MRPFLLFYGRRGRTFAVPPFVGVMQKAGECFRKRKFCRLLSTGGKMYYNKGENHEKEGIT